MAIFNARTIRSNTLGSFLKEQRLSQGWTLEEVSRRISIAEKYLDNIENDQFYKLLSLTYSRGFLERYSQFLGLDSEEILTRWRKETANFPNPSILDKKRIKHLPLDGFQKKWFWLNLDLKIILIILVILSISIYLGLGIKRVLFPPEIEIFEPSPEMITAQNTIIIKGKTDARSEVYINQELVNRDQKGYFEQELKLLPGLNLIEISAKKRYSKFNKTELKIMVLEEEIKGIGGLELIEME